MTEGLIDAQPNVVERFTYGAVGNRTEPFNTVDGLLQETRLKLANAEQVQTLISDLHYNPTGQLESERLGNGVVSEKAYEAETGRMIRILSSRADSAILQDLNYRYDPVYDSSGQRCRKIRRALAKSRTLVGGVRYLKALELRTEVMPPQWHISRLRGRQQ